MNANIPYQKAFVKNSYVYSEYSEELSECYIFGVKATINKPLLFHMQLSNGAVFWNLPISAFTWKKDFDELSLNQQKRLCLLQYWDCQSNDIDVTTFAYLQGHIVDCYARNKKWMSGVYLFTIDDYYSNLNNLPLGYATDSDSKCFHFIKLDNGNYCLYPNNFLRWHNLNFVDPFVEKPKFKTNTSEFSCEIEF